MKKHFLILALGFTLSSTTLFTSCKENAKTEEKAVVIKNTETPNTLETAAPEPDTSATSLPVVTTSNTSPAAAQKFGYINSADLIKIMPETRRAEANLEAYVKTLEKHFSSLQNEYQTKIQDFQAQEKTMVDAVKESKIKDIQGLEQRMQQTQMSGQQQVAAKREQLFKPILDKAEKAIVAVGKENGYDYIFDKNNGSFVYAKESHDVMPLVKAKLGLK